MAFDVAGARAAGYSDEEIAGYLGEQNKFDSAGALSAGYSPSEIINHLSGTRAGAGAGRGSVNPPMATDEVGMLARMAASGQNPIRERTLGEVATDTGAQLLEGAANIAGAIPSLIAPESGVAETTRYAADYWRNKQSEPIRQRMALADRSINAAGEDGVIAQIVEAAKQYSSDPALAARFVTTNLASMIPGIGAAKLAQAAALARGATAIKAAGVATTVAGGTNAVLNAGGARGGAYEEIKKAAEAQGATPEEAEAQAIAGSRLPAVVGAVTGYVSGKTGLEKAIVGNPASALGKSAVTRGVVSGAAELGGEQIEEVLPQIATNYEAGQIDGRSLTKDIGRTIVETAIGSAPGAAISGVATGLAEPTPATPAAPRVQDQPTTPTVPTPTNGLNGILQREGLITPTSGDPIAGMDDASILNRIPVEGQDGQTNTGGPAPTAAPTVQPAGDDRIAAIVGEALAELDVPNAGQPAQPTGQPAAPATISNPPSAIPSTQRMDAGSVQARLANELAALRQRNEEAAAKAEAERVKAEAEAAAKTASTGTNYQQKDSTPVSPPGVAPNPQAVTALVEAGKGTAGKYADVSNTALYTEPVLYGIINHPNVGPELLDVARTELNRRRGNAPNANVNTSASITGIPGNTGTRVAAPTGGSAGVAPTSAQGIGDQVSGEVQLGQPIQSAKPPQGGGTAANATRLAPAPAADSANVDAARRALYRAKKVTAVQSNAPLTNSQSLASVLANLFGRTFTVVERKQGPKNQMPNGFIMPGTNDIYVDKDSEDSPLFVTVHEIWHTLPEHIKAKAGAAIRALFDSNKEGEFGREFGVAKEEFGEEIPAYMVQAISKREDFWQNLRAKMGNSDFMQFATEVLRQFKRILGMADKATGKEFLDKYVGDEAKILKARDLLIDAYVEAAREQGVQPDAEVTGRDIQASEKPKAVEDQDGEPDDSRATIEQGDIPESVDTPATLESTLKLAGSKVWNKGRDLKVAMQEAVQAAARAAGVDVGAPSEATTKYLTRVGVKDALSALKQNANAVGWYDLKTRQALAVMSLVHPELARDENARFAMVWAMAVTSNGLKVGKNFEIAEKVYSEYKRTGEMPPNMGIGNAAKAINQSLALFNELKEAWGIDNLRKFMLTNFTVKEITGIQKDLKPGGEHADVVVKGAAILGPKIGNGFFSNLYGNFDALTMDRWLIRTWGRWTGTLISPMEKQTAKAKERLQTNLAEILKDPTEVSRLSEALGKQITSDMSVDDLAMAVQKASMEPATRKVMNATGTGEELRKAGNGLAKYLDGQKEAPAGPTERKYIRKVFGEILSELRKSPEYKDLSMADLQAVLWYAEKRLYESAKEDPSDEEVAGYSDDDAPDYANAASDVARAAGVSDRKIQNALKREEQNGRTGTTRSGDEQAEPDRFGLAPAPGSFADQERRDFVAWQAFKRISANRRLGGSELSWAYEGKSTGDGGRVRVLKKLGVSYVAEWTLGQKAKNVLKANDLFSAKLYELAPGDINNAQKFADAITASKNSAKAGAAVYVYPVQSTEDETGYADMRLFLVENGKSGVAVKRNGDIVSVFGEKGAGMAHSLMQVALAAGGRKLDAFDTILPRLYSLHGFRVVARIPWNDDPNIKPAGWDKETFKAFNGGEPDVVFMAYDPHHGELYQAGDGKVYDDYDKAVAAQTRAVNKVAKDVPRSGPIFSNKPKDLDQDITLTIPVEGGKTAKLTVNAKSYIDTLNKREDALRMVKECMI